jgi:phosphoglycolate phosphatase-like HAD superfamily hydrolase
MLILDDTNLPDRTGNLEIVRRLGRRVITHAFHDVDGTHSLIREWPPVMSALVSWVIASGLPDGYDGDANAARLAARIDSLRTDETDRFATESAGVTALTQMEWAIRRALQEGALTLPGKPLSEDEASVNAEVIQRIWDGRERFADLPHSLRLQELVTAHTPRLFHLYETMLSKASRDRNLAAARKDPAAWRVPGSLEFLQRLHAAGVENRFVTGSVMSTDQLPQGMLEEILVLGFEVGPGKLIEAVHGSHWDRKLPKDEVMRDLVQDYQIDSVGLLVIGDGRAEIKAGADLGAAVISRLSADASRQHRIHRHLGAHYIIPDYTEPALSQLPRT